MSDACIRCKGELEVGFIADRGDYNATQPAQWASGEPSRSFWTKGSMRPGERRLEITTYRCRDCGRLESFARDA